MRNDENKELDKLFQKRLSNDKPAENKWNVPPIDVFEGALSKIGEEEEPKKRRYFIPFLLGGLIIIGGLVFMLVQNQKMIQALDAKIEVLNEKQASNTETNNKIPTKKITSENLTNQNDSNNSVLDVNKDNTLKTAAAVEQNSNAQASTTINPKTLKRALEIGENSNVPVVSTAATFNPQNTTPVIGNTANQISQNTFPPTTEKLSTAIITKENKLSNVAVADIEENEILALANPIASLNLFIDHQSTNNLPLAYVEPIKKQSNHTDNKFSVYAYGGLNFSAFKLDGWFEDDMTSVTGHDNSKVGYQSGVEVNYRVLPKWSVGSSVGYRQIVNNSTCNGQVEYDKDYEMVNADNQLVYRTTNHVMTPMGDIDEMMEIHVDENEMADGDILDSKTVNQQILHANNVSAAVHYHALKFGKFDLSLNGGAGLNFNLRRELLSDMSIHFEDKEMMQKSTREDDMKIGYNSFVTYFGGLNLDYHLMPRVNVRLGTNYEGSIRDLRNSHDNSQGFKLKSINTNLSVGYTF